MIRIEKYSRLVDIDHEIQTAKFRALPPHQRSQRYHEALTLCEDLGLDSAWQRYKAFLERLQQDEFARQRQATTAYDQGDYTQYIQLMFD